MVLAVSHRSDILPTLLRQSKTQSRDFEPIRMVECSQHGPDNAEDQVVEKDQPVDNPEVQAAFLSLLAKEAALLGLTTWAFMPITFGLAWKGYLVCLYVFVAVKLSITSVLQAMVCKQTGNALREQMVNSLEVRALDRSSSWLGLPVLHGMTLWEIGTLTLSAMLSLGDCVLRLLEAIDPDSDAITPGQAKRSLSDKDNMEFSESWVDVPLVGSHVAQLGLPCVLALGLAAVALWQIYLFSHIAFKLKAALSYPSPRRFSTYGLLYHMTDVAGLHIMSSQIRCLWIALAPVEAPAMAAIGGDRYHSYLSRVPEMVFQGWFSVSALVYSIDGPSDAVLAILFSIFTTFAASLKSFYEMASIFVPWSRHVSSASWGRWLPHRLFACLVFHFFGTLALFIRLIGVWGCDTHDFHLSKMKCRH